MKSSKKITKTKRSFFYLIAIFLFIGCCNTQCQNNNNTSANTNSAFKKDTPMKLNNLTKEEERVIINKGTEMPFTGKYTDEFEKGT